MLSWLVQGKKGKLKTIAEDPDETEEEAQRILEELQGTLDPGKQAAGPAAPAPGISQTLSGLHLHAIVDLVSAWLSANNGLPGGSARCRLCSEIILCARHDAFAPYTYAGASCVWCFVLCHPARA